LERGVPLAQRGTAYREGIPGMVGNAAAYMPVTLESQS